jgi:hypothetical protein
MSLLSKNGKLATLGGALVRYIQSCADKCCKKWYCHLPSYTCDQIEMNHISEHATQAECLQQCGDGVEHYCHTDYTCDTDPTGALASYPSKSSCEANCRADHLWYCCYLSTDFTRGSECQQGKCADEGLVRDGPFESEDECKESCESLYYCVRLAGTNGDDPADFQCVIDPTGQLVISGPTTQVLCEQYCSTRKKTIWCVDNKRCVVSYDGPPPECSFGVFCEEHDTYDECVADCLPEKWYCVTPGDPCQQLASPPAPGAPAYSSQAACDDECDSYYCCWVSQGDPTQGSYCQLGECDPGFERSGPHDDKKACEDDCHRIYCWSYNDITTPYSTVKVCQEDSPDGCTASYSCLGQPMTIFGPLEEERARAEEQAFKEAGFDTDLSQQPNGEWYLLYNCPRDQPAENCDNRICEGPLLPATCVNENVAKDSGPYGKLQECATICNPPTYKWYCKDNVCTKCCASGNCGGTIANCPDGVTLYDSAGECDGVCVGPPPCPPGQSLKWWLPDCGPGPCTPLCIDNDLTPCEGFPYDCDSEASCNAWLDAHPNPPCPPPTGPCGVPVPSSVTVNLCDFVDRAPLPFCLPDPDTGEPQAGYAAFFNQTVELTLLDFLLPDSIVWKGNLDLPAGWPRHELELQRGTETGNGCDYAYMSIQTLDGGQQCVNGFWGRNRDGVALPPYSDGWVFGTNTTSGPMALQTQETFWQNIGVTSGACRITFDCADCGPPEPPCAGESEQGTWQLEFCDEEDCTYVVCGQTGSGVGPKFLTLQACRDCHNLRETCSLDHPLCVLNRNPLP